MANATILRTKMSKTKDMVMTIGVDEKQHIDQSHDMYFVRVHFDIRRALEMVTPGNPFIIRLNRMGNRLLMIYRNDNHNTIRQSITDILEYCTKNGIKEVAFCEHELKGVIINDIIAKYDVEVFLTTIK